uniref:Eif3 n=1 Tax=Arundo donax TaxID=35708 RepID=A0A0A9F4X2_ARUDO
MVLLAELNLSQLLLLMKDLLFLKTFLESLLNQWGLFLSFSPFQVIHCFCKLLQFFLHLLALLQLFTQCQFHDRLFSKLPINDRFSLSF